MKLHQLLTLIVLLTGVATLTGQSVYTGTVSELDGSAPLIGVYVVNQASGAGTVTDLDGRFEITGEVGDTLEISYTGYETQRYALTTQTDLIFELGSATALLDEVVVVGYGTQRSRDLTSAITTISDEEIERTPAAVVTQSLQGRVPGLQIVSAGAPGASPQVRVRGVGSFPGNNTEAPLYVVDGMFFDNIDFLSAADVKSVSVLKDASAAAIYGVRAANGVILIETRSGKFDQPARITYNGYYGVQRAQNVVKMANAEQFTRMALESGSEADATFIQNAFQRYGRSRINPNVPDVNTDWYEAILRDGPIQSHSVDVTGGSARAAYAVGVNYFDQEGILDMPNEYERFNLRSKVDFKATDWFSIGGNVIVSNANQTLPENGAWFSAYYAVPIMPVFDPMSADTVTMLSNAQDLGYRGGQNPLAITLYNTNEREIRKLLGNFYVEFNLLPEKLTFKSAYNSSFTSINDRNLNFPYFIGNDFQRDISSITRNSNQSYNQIWDNLLTYEDSYGGHNLTVLLGSSYRDERFEFLRATGEGFPVQSPSSWFLDQVPDENINQGSVGGGAARLYGQSYFTRLAYNFNNRYLLYGTFRADGSNKYRETWGYFPTVGAGWVLSEESFFDLPFIDYLKLRGSWGELGNDQIPADDRLQSITLVNTSLGNRQVSGVQTGTVFSSLAWEVVEEINLGLNAELFQGKVTVEADYYIRDTKNAVIPVEVPVTGERVRQNAGVIRNSGLEVALGYRNKTEWGLGYRLNANFATLSNEVQSLFGQPFIDGGSAEFRQRSIVGQPVAAFFGLELDGVYQNEAEISGDPVAVSQDLEPGDLRYVDQNGDGAITGEDRVILGSYLPSYSWGGNVGLTYDNFDLAVTFFGQGGNKILNRRRGEVIFTNDTNIDADLAENAWRGEGTSNIYPSSAGRRKAWNQQLSDQWVEDGTFWRIQNAQLGYTLRQGTLFGANSPAVRFYVTADRPLTVFDYNGFTPEIGNGVDRQVYPVPATYTGGVSVTF
jgi:TonB-linked SusC/RagA family outer membrane protein